MKGLVKVPPERSPKSNFETHPDSPGKRGCPNISSAMTHPADQTSIREWKRESVSQKLFLKGKKCRTSFENVPMFVV